MRYFQIPAAIELKHPSTGSTIGTPYPFKTHAHVQWLADRRWYTPITRLARIVGVQKVLEQPEGSAAELEDADWAILKEIIDAPTVTNLQPNPLVQVQLAAFDRAVLDAPTKRPESPKAETA